MNAIANATGRGLVLAVTLLIAACASAPINLGASDGAEPAQVHLSLRAAASEVVETAQTRSWRASRGGARGFLGRLISGADGDDGDEAGGADAYLAALAQARGEASLETLRVDVALAEELARALALRCDFVIQDQALTDRQALSRDIAAAEAALTVLRAARTVFAEADATLSEPGESRLSLTELDDAIEALAAAADAIAARRWALRHGAVS